MINYIRRYKTLLFQHPADYLPQLDFLRTIAITLVIFTHAAEIFKHSGGEQNLLTEFPLVVGGWVGVDLFFVLSGFLIGGQLCKEYIKHGRINYLTFIIKRSLRIWPLYFIILIFFVLIRGPFSSSWYFSDFYFLSNYIKEGGIKGSWSLAIEEQFYILLPLLFFIISKFKFSIKSCLYISALMILSSPIIRYFTWEHVTQTNPANIRSEIDFLYFPFHTHMDGLFMGVFLAGLALLIKEKKEIRTQMISLVLLVLTICSVILRHKYRIYFNYTCFAFLFGTILWWIVHQNISLKSNQYSTIILSIIAKLSFGVYLIHYQFLLWMMPTLGQFYSFLPHELNFLFSTSSIYLVCLFIAGITYRHIEHPFLEIRKKIVKS